MAWNAGILFPKDRGDVAGRDPQARVENGLDGSMDFTKNADA